MFDLRKLIPIHRTASRSTPEDVVREAEAVVHRCWLDQLTERRREMEAALRRAADRCDAAQHSLTAAQRSGDPRMIAVSQRDLEKALEAARKTLLAWERTCRALSSEADLL
ncbi:hypothetical protein Caci_3570 [Catenulispora acidiphila DSM 44928]|uniref:Uncharacterized protein n=1 Tax=Catenulispora acidiphila (strain DSM 44928 / JCM 14897 / NBRC 102108 / NRRL B-24433 / ID139908) TaxID=479433 RepID=C7QAH6_CATAD|nr:hypothetical protein [Catenulispora acidiphila]ACU72475.1 hypothetical protein Caci_3570 [Catenulispora acidiphila DSM 44928]